MRCQMNVPYIVNLRSGWTDIFKYMCHVFYYELYDLVIVFDTPFHFLQMFPVFRQELLMMLW